MTAVISMRLFALALLLTFVGVYGVIGYAVERRRQESGYAWRWERGAARSLP